MYTWLKLVLDNCMLCLAFGLYEKQNEEITCMHGLYVGN